MFFFSAEQRNSTVFFLGKSFELLAINYSFSERRDSFVSWSCPDCFTTCMSALFPAVELDDIIRFSTLFRVSGFL